MAPIFSEPKLSGTTKPVDLAFSLSRAVQRSSIIGWVHYGGNTEVSPPGDKAPPLKKLSLS